METADTSVAPKLWCHHSSLPSAVISYCRSGVRKPTVCFPSFEGQVGTNRTKLAAFCLESSLQLIFYSRIKKKNVCDCKWGISISPHEGELFYSFVCSPLLPRRRIQGRKCQNRNPPHSDSHTFLHPSFPAPLSCNIAVEKQRRMYLCHFHVIHASWVKRKNDFSGVKSKYASERGLQNRSPERRLAVFENTDSLQVMHTKTQSGLSQPFVGTEVTVIFPPSLALEGPSHLSLPSVSAAQLRLHSVFQRFHLLVMMFRAEPTGRKLYQQYLWLM